MTKKNIKALSLTDEVMRREAKNKENQPQKSETYF